jgi:DNA-binding FadR family transcriptional regulator
MLMLLEMLLGLSARLAAANIDKPAARKDFQRIFDALMSYRTRPDSFDLVRARNSFYRKLVEVGGNRELGRVLSGMHVHLLRVQFRMHQSEIEKQRFSDYQSIGEAVVAGNARQAELAAKRHVRRIAASIGDLPDGTFMPEA